jgi:hypothetical protein
VSPGAIRALITGLLLVASPVTAGAQVFLASRPNPDFMVGPLFVRVAVTPELGVTLDVLWSLMIPPSKSGGAIAQDLYLLWPNSVGVSSEGAPDPALAAYVTARGFTPIKEGRLPLFAQSLYRSEEVPPEPVKGGAPFVTFVRLGGPLGLTAPVTYVRIPWTPLMANRTWLMDLRMEVTDLVKRRNATWIEDLFWGPHYSLALTFNDVRPRALFPLYFEHRDRVIRLAEDPSQLVINLRDADHLKIYDVFPRTANRRLSETLDSTEEISMFLDRSEGITPQVLTAQFGYFKGLRTWAPVIIPIVFFFVGNLTMPVFMMIFRRTKREITNRVHIGPGDFARETGVVLSRDALARIVPGTTTYEDVLRIGGGEPEEHEQLATPDRRTVFYRGSRIVPQQRRRFGWLATVAGWSVEQHEVEITLDRNVVADVQARVRRSPLPPTASG